MSTETKRVSRGSKAPRVQVKVTKEIIEVAARRDSSHCMIADAVREAVPTAKTISVDLASIRFTDKEKGLRYIYFTPRIGQLNLLRFDQGDEDIEPFEFTLRGAQVVRANVKTVDNKDVTGRQKFKGSPNHHGGVPTKVGGQAPPIGPLTNSPKVKVGKRREFGLRALTR